MDRFCDNCGHDLKQGGSFCPGCGKPVSETARVPTTDADVSVPPPPSTDQSVGRGTETTPRRRSGVGRLFVGCLATVIALVAAIVGIVVLLLLFGGGEGDQASSGESFTKKNYGRLISDPGSFVGAKVDVTGQVFTPPEIVGEETSFQMFADPKSSEWNTVVYIDGTNLDLSADDYVRVVGTVEGSMDGENAFGGTVTAVEVQASKVEPVSAVEAVDPTQGTKEVSQTLSDQGFSITLQKIEFGKESTRAYVTASNGTNAAVSFYDFDAKIMQGSQQLDAETPFDYEVKAPQSELSPGAETEGVMVFGKVDSSQPLEVSFEWSSDNYDVTSNPLVFQVSP